MGHQCCSKQKVKRGLWSPEEDEKLITHITIHGHTSWSSVPKLAGTSCSILTFDSIATLQIYFHFLHIPHFFRYLRVLLSTTMQSLNPNHIGPASRIMGRGPFKCLTG